ncbi:MAG: SDR family NAD(P)-dependent oxidoreductase [Clostridiales bacterium]|jgi:short-subunit dehydrogenase|nr:SDR family NAD(P)-dependent oxidoreductase [Clostridiales bacterium]HOB63795.1 SDR family NAD(P)-dependent oxidoreductase [Clostridia bacterium]HOL60819.1 SDR family NAD(P)-dependent oxidoreductase [Clostridia bacterium]
MNRVVMIVGASSGIGLAAAKKFIESGDIVYNCSRRKSPLEGIKNLTLDIVNTPDIRQRVEEIMENEKRLDIVVNCAGFSMAAPVEYVKSEDYRYLFDVNFFGAIELIKAVVPNMRPAGGKIILISSLGGVTPIPYDPYYSASKAALNILAEALSFELEKQNIYITSVMPGGTKTDFSFKRKIYKEEEVKQYEDDFRNAVSSLQHIEQKGMPAEAVADTILYVADLPNPPLIVASGIKNKINNGLYKILPRKVTHAITKMRYNLRP